MEIPYKVNRGDRPSESLFNTMGNNTFAIFLKPLMLRALRARNIKGFRKMAIMLRQNTT